MATRALTREAAPTAHPLTETQMQANVDRVDAQLVEARAQHASARRRFLLHIGLTYAAHADADRFAGSEQEMHAAEKRMADLEVHREALLAGACFVAWEARQSTWAEIRRRGDALSTKIDEYSDVSIELHRRELVQQRALGSMNLGVQMPATPTREYQQNVFPERKAAREALLAEKSANDFQAMQVQAALVEINKRYGAELVKEIAGR
jgi:hypothetical protein